MEGGAREEDGIRCKSENLALLRVHRPSGSEKAQKGAHWRLFPTVAEDEGYEGGENQEHLPPHTGGTSPHTQKTLPPAHSNGLHRRQKRPLSRPSDVAIKYRSVKLKVIRTHGQDIQ